MKYLLLTFLLLIGCAKPNYVSPDAASDRYAPSQNACPLYFNEERLCLSMKWVTYPNEETLGTFIMTFFAEENPEKPITPHFTPFVKLWMPSMGHGSSPVVITQTAAGTYLVSDVYFIMLGAWEIRFQLKNNNDVIEEQIQKINL